MVASNFSRFTDVRQSMVGKRLLVNEVVGLSFVSVVEGMMPRIEEQFHVPLEYSYKASLWLL